MSNGTEGARDYKGKGAVCQVLEVRIEVARGVLNRGTERYEKYRKFVAELARWQSF